MGGDFIALASSFILAYIIRTNIDVKPLGNPTARMEYFQLILLSAGIGIVIFFFVGLYSLKKPQTRVEELKKIFIAVSSGIMLILVLDFFSNKHIFPAKSIPIYAWGLAIILVFFTRQILREVQRYLFKYGIGVQNLVVIGANRISYLVLSEIKKKPYLGYRVLGIFDRKKEPGTDFAGFKILGSEENLSEVLKQQKVDEIIQANPQLPVKKVIDIINLAEKYKIDFKLAPSLFGVYSSYNNIHILGGIPVVELKKTPLDGWGRIIKRGVDIAGGAFGLIIFSPVMLLISIIMKLTSKGPILYKHKRIGRYGKEFEVYKFRSMKIDYCMGDEYGGDKAQNYFNKMLCDPEKKKEFSEDFKLKNDPRVTKLGKFLRKTSLDELPQFINVLKGEMSLVGPRPVVREELKKYGPYQQQRLLLKPGVTGLWQIGGRNDLNYKERIKLDIYYIEKWSLPMDIKIIFKTVLVFLGKKDAY